MDTSSLAYQSGGSVGASAGTTNTAIRDVYVISEPVLCTLLTGSESSNDDDDPDADKVR